MSLIDLGLHREAKYSWVRMVRLNTRLGIVRLGVENRKIETRKNLLAKSLDLRIGTPRNIFD